jgi:hypothetical protein
MFFSDLHVDLLSRGILNPGERLVGQTVTGYMPWWAFGFIRRQYLVLATDQRLVLVDHRYSFFNPTVQRLHGVDSLAWSGVQEAKVTGLFLKKKLKVRGQSDHGPISLNMAIPNGLFGLLAPMKNNMPGARAVAAAAQSLQGGGMPALGAAPQQHYSQPPPMSYAPPQQLQAPQSYGPPSYAPPQQAQAAYGQPPMPAVNAPGYNSVPPAQPQYGAPVPSPFDPPRQY